MAAAAIDLASPAMEVVLAFVEATIKHPLLDEKNQILTHPRRCLPACLARMSMPVLF